MKRALSALPFAAVIAATLMAASATWAATPHAATHEGKAHPPHTTPWLVVVEQEAFVQRQAVQALAHARVTPQALAAVDRQAARTVRELADTVLAREDHGNAPLAQDARALSASLARAEHARHASRSPAMDALHARVAALREAEQQSWIAQGVRRGRLNAAQVAAIEREQARILDAQAQLEQRGLETVDEALGVQHAQDVQDWSIRTGHLPGEAQA